MLSLFAKYAPLRYSRGLLGGNPVVQHLRGFTPSSFAKSVRRKSNAHLVATPITGSPSPTTELEDDATSGMTEDSVVISEVSPHFVIPEVCQSEIQYASSGQASTWIPEYYLGDDGR